MARRDRRRDVDEPRRRVRVPEDARETGIAVRQRGAKRGLLIVVGEDGEDRIAVTLCVVEAPQREEHPGIAWSVPFPRERRLGGGAMNGLAREVHRTDQREIHLARAEASNGKLQGHSPRRFFGGNGETRGTKVELLIEAIRDHVRHASEDGGGAEGRLGRTSSGSGVDSKAVARDASVDLHADQESGAFRRSTAGDVRELVRQSKQEELLRERLSQIRWRHVEAACVELEGRAARLRRITPELHLGVEDRRVERLRRRCATRHDGFGNDRHVLAQRTRTGLRGGRG